MGRCLFTLSGPTMEGTHLPNVRIAVPLHRCGSVGTWTIDPLIYSTFLTGLSPVEDRDLGLTHCTARLQADTAFAALYPAITTISASIACCCLLLPHYFIKIKLHFHSIIFLSFTSTDNVLLNKCHGSGCDTSLDSYRSWR